MAMSPLLQALGLGGATIGAGAALHGAGVGSLLEPLDWPRRSLWNSLASPYRAIETGDPSQLLGAIPGMAGAAVGGLVGGPLGILAGSVVGGGLQGVGESTGMSQFQAPSIEDVTGTDSFLPNMALGMATDPLMYAGLSGSWRAARGAEAGGKLLKDAGEAGIIGKEAGQIGDISQMARKKTVKGKNPLKDLPSTEPLVGQLPEGMLFEPQINPELGYATEHYLMSGGEAKGGVSFGPSGAVMEKRAADMIFPGVVKPGENVARTTGIELFDEALHGKGLGQRLYLEGMANHPADWFYNSQTEAGATNALKAMERKGLVELHWDRVPDYGQSGGKHLVRLTDKGRAEASRLKGVTPDRIAGDTSIGGVDDLFGGPEKQVLPEGGSVPVAKRVEDVPVAKTPADLAPTFYSRLERAIEGLPDKPLIAEELKSLLDRASRKGGMNYSQEEVRATNLYDIFERKPEVTKAELLDHFRQNQIQLEDKWLGEGVPHSQERIGLLAEKEKMLEELRATYEIPEGGRRTAIQERINAQLERVEAELELDTTMQTPRWSQHKTPGGVPGTYKEWIGKLPERPRVIPEGFEVKEVPGRPGEYAVFSSEGKQVGVGRSTPEAASKGYGVDTNSSEETHFPGEKNAVAFVQMQDRMVNGKKYLEVMTTQSDLHQAGRDAGYITAEGKKIGGEKAAALAAEQEKLMAEMKATQDEHSSLLDRPYESLSLEELERSQYLESLMLNKEGTEPIHARLSEIADKLQKIGDPVPDFPFKDNWHELAMKRMIRHAAENGYDGIIISPGSEVNKMLSSDARSLMGQKKFYGEPGEQISGSLPNWLKKYAKQHGVEVSTGEVAGAASVRAKELEREIGELTRVLQENPNNFRVRQTIRQHERELELLGPTTTQATKMDMNPQMRQNVLFNGQSLMAGAGVGGSALLMALANGGQS